MKLIQIVYLVFICLSGHVVAQTPIQKYWVLNQNIYLLDQTAPISSPSFAYSLRKLRRSYPGFAIRVRRGTDNATADVAFDPTGIVSTGSKVTVVAAGSSGLTAGGTMSLDTFKGTQQLLVSIWYDQGLKVYDAAQTVSSMQPELLLNTAGTSSTKPSIYFNGSRYLEVNQPIQNIVTNGIVGTFLLAIKATSNSDQFSFGYLMATGWRWTLHLNWEDGNCFFDAGELCCGVTSTRIFDNDPGGLNVWKQYSFVRETGHKAVRRSGVSVLNASQSSTSRTGGKFFIGSAYGKPAMGSGSKNFSGNMAEVIMFPKDFSVAQLQPVERNQIGFWNL